MKIAVISDVHANLAALDAVLAFLKTRSISTILCLGDIVGYGPSPNECVERIKRSCLYSVLGNHDAAALGSLDISAFNKYARMAVQWTAAQLTVQNRAYLSSLPLLNRFQQSLLVHSAPGTPDSWNYVFSYSDAAEVFSNFSESLCFIGHSHMPAVFSRESGALMPAQVQLRSNDQYLINVGSIGQPRDGDPRACLVIWDQEENSIRFHRVEYDIQETQNAMRRNKLPEYLIRRLENGR